MLSNIVLRVLSIVVIFVMSAPAASWGGSLLPDGIGTLDPTCCFGSVADRDEDQRDAQLERACCCKPKPSAPAVEGQHVLLVPQDDWRPPPALPGGLIEPAARPVSRHIATHQAARAPPPARSLLAQQTSLLL